MEEKQTRLLVWLVGILAGLVALIVLVKPPDDKGDEEGKWTRAFGEVEAAQVVALRVDRDGSTFALERADGEWRITTPAAARADGKAVDRLVDTLVGLEVGEPLGEEDLAQYGLEPPTATVVATLAPGRTLELRLGRDAPVGWTSYVQVAEEKAARSARNRLSGSLGKTLDDLRSKELVAFSTSAVDGLTVETIDASVEGGGPPLPRSLAFHHDEHGWWVQAGGQTVRADEEKVTDLVAAVSDLRADAFPSGPQALPDLGTTVTVRAGDAAHVVQLSAPEGGRRTARGPLQDGPVEVLSPRLDELLALEPEAWASRRLLPVRAVTVDALAVELGEHKLSASRSEGTWAPPEAEGFLDALDEVRVDRSVALAAEGQPWGRIELDEGTNRSEEVVLYQPTAEGGRVAVDSAGGPGFVVPGTEIQRLVDALP